MSLVQRFAQNTQGRDFVVGDVRGGFDYLLVMLENIPEASATKAPFCQGCPDSAPDRYGRDPMSDRRTAMVYSDRYRIGRRLASAAPAKISPRGHYGR